MTSAERTILVAEDSEDDRFILAEAMRAARISNPVQFVNDGRQAVAYLSGTEPFADRGKHPLPAFVILDFKMPLMNGLEVLAWIRSSEHRRMPVIILSASALPGDIERAYDLHVNSYVMKPSTLDSLVSLMRALSGFWVEYNEHPRAPET